jgi:hypothetical protein|tara:strand:+ start:5049 stop:5198 length:150 start_codon:yes stop_codon:yes gene_type:complete
MPYAVTSTGKPMVLPYKSKKINDKVVVKTAAVSHHTDRNNHNDKDKIYA